MKTVPYQPKRPMDLGLAGTMKQRSGDVPVSDHTREDVAKFERHWRRAVWCILWLPLSALVPFGLMLWLKLKAGPAASLLVVLPCMATFCWYTYNILRSTRCIWCRNRVDRLSGGLNVQCCPRCAQPLTLKAWDARVPSDNAGSSVPR